ncbi:MAG TPA: primosomal protein N' [Cytophagales bacterium]|nr:primosomal protein N' [Cytophagales bacterium]HCR54424.1 primosomal protein N' [Cytophagales bacterium]
MTKEEAEFDTHTFFAEIILPVPIPKLFTYRIPAALNEIVKTGQRVIVQFGQKKILTGIIANLHQQPPTDYEAKYILEIIDENEVIGPRQFSLYQWMADYYMCTPGEVINAALPSGLKLSSESMVQLHPSFHWEETSFDFSEKERMLINRLRSDTLSYTDVAKFLGTRNLYSLLKSLASKEAIILFEKVKEKFKPKTEKRIRLTKTYTVKKALEKLFEEMVSKPKQESLLLKYLQSVPVFTDVALNAQGVAKADLSEGESASSLNTLIKNKIFEEYETIVPRFGFETPKETTPLLLSEKQEEARNTILNHFDASDVVLLHGVTGSGKTEIYIDLIKRALEGGSQALLLIPEIALTTQIVQRLKKIFGAEMGVYHSKFSDNERVEVWNGILSGKFQFVVGVRSSVFLPFDNLGLVIVDEEHDSSYKQHDPAPRYQARDIALVMANIHHAKVILGSATPSAESFYHCTQGKFKLVSLMERFGEANLPEITFADMAIERQRKSNKGEFSSVLLKGIADALKNKEQVILFQNRRGYAPMVQCEDCNWIPKCINCSVSLTYHQYRHEMVCHYCGYRESLPSACPTCTSKRILTKGYGTEKLEEELKLIFPEARIQRMDWDTTRTRSSYESIIESFQQGETDVLVGTQMVTKGLDFDRVSLVGVFDADRMMHFPDFRAHERAFQLIIQVSGRSGRREKKGNVIIQTADPKQTLFHYVLQHDIPGYIQTELEDRKAHFYPPFSRLIEITIKHTDRMRCKDIATSLGQAIRNQLRGPAILGPGEPLVGKIRNEFLMSILIKIPRDGGKLKEIKQRLSEISDHVLSEKQFRSGKIIFDVDPV